MSDAPQEEKVPEAEQYLAAFKAKCQAVPEPLRGLFLDYLVPTLEAQRNEYVDGLDFVAEAVEEGGGGLDPEFFNRVFQTLGAINALADMALKRGGWADAQGMPTPECPADLKMAFNTAQQFVNALASEIKEMQTNDDANDGKG